MKGLFSLFFLALVSFLGYNSCSGRVSFNPFPLGTIGCLVSDVCGSGEICANDRLFGSCQNIFTRALTGEPKFTLETREIKRLAKSIKRLIRTGFTWKDAFTQCTLQNTLVEFGRGRLFDSELCKDALSLSSDDIISQGINEEIATVLLQLLENGDVQLIDDDASQEDPGIDGFNSNKRDEIVQVHKYFDRSAGQLKRDPYSDSPYQYIYSSLNEDGDDVGKSDEADPRYLEPSADAYSKLLSDSQNENFPAFDTDSLADDDAISKYEDNSISSDTLEPHPFQSEISDESFQPKLDEGQEISDDSSQSELDDSQEDLNLTDEDEETLELLLEGSIQPEYLDKAQQRRLQRIIEGLITVLDNGDTTEVVEKVPASDEESEDLSSPNDHETIIPQQINDVMQEEDVDDDDGDGDRDDEGETGPEDKRDNNVPYSVQSNSNDDADITERLQTAHIPEVQELATRDDDTSQEAEDTKEPIDTHSMYMQLSKEVDIPTAIMFVHNLTRIIKLPPQMIGFTEVGPDNLINLEINTDPEEKLDAEKIAKEALKAKDELEKETGIYVIRAGIGREDNGVEVKESNRNVVLTFILVGSIAGVVLAVLTIYLIKRHAKFKQKLAHMASNPDGNEASKDYQDLCRQRMQGKSSEKPEPLHAASRIGSVSESQARSPSSRSSTSSWSEEPAATNMDISTGHIVLSYMEDHLKNQDRLDKEWEAVSGYSADPSSTKVATDQSNTRKNRFADILPYDHSRVVLVSDANVANSDYINANFITDHDPRNPAYICTQGPLPHTVADFWQMIWEQGSVVIVMLTKLAENGTSLCHRYWPEEGSDLYHIYEVHLVSEHIWCDDYLVRSFYLKNLQTNETRTVTQFHFLTWPQLSVPASIKALLDFRRKVNKSFRGRACPIVVHCSDGCGRSGTYCLIDMVLNKMAKGAKEIDMAATLEHIRDQRMSMVKTKEQFQFSLAAVAEEVHAILKALPQ